MTFDIAKDRRYEIAHTWSMSILYVVTWGYFSLNWPIIGDNNLPAVNGIYNRQQINK